MSLFGLGRNQRTFRPKKSAPSGSKGAQLRKHIDATLGSGNLREAVRLPPGEDMNEWLAVNRCDGLVYKGALKVSTRHNLKQRRKISAFREKHSGAIVSIGKLGRGGNLVTASEDGGVWIWDLEMGQVVNVVGEEMKSISGLVVANGFDEFGSFPVRMGGGVADGVVGFPVERATEASSEGGGDGIEAECGGAGQGQGN